MPQDTTRPGDPALARRLSAAVEGEVCFDPFTRGLYATDASHYQIEPLGVVFPRTTADVEAALGVAREEGVPVLPRGGGTSQCGQTVGRAVVLDVSRHLTGVDFDEATGEVVVAPGVILDDLNRTLRPRGLWFPVDPSTSNRATLGGMAGNNSAGARSIRYGMMVDNVAAAEVLLSDGRRLWTGEGGVEAQVMATELAVLRSLYAREADEIAARAPRTMRNVAGYRLERLAPERENLAQLLVGSEGTLAFFTKLRLRLAPFPVRRVLGVCHFPTLLQALDAVQHLVPLGPSAVELVDENVLRLAAERPAYQASLARFVRGTPGALLLVEFASEVEGADLGGDLDRLEEAMGDLGLPGAVLRAEEPGLQAAVWSVRKAGLNIVMSMAGPRKPVSFLEDCVVPLEHLAEYARRMDDIFHRHDTTGTWYAHASVGCLHVRPAMNLKDPADVARMRRIAEEAHAVVRQYKGTHSGEHGDGLVRSEFLEPMLGARMVQAFREVKDTLDPRGLMNPGKIVDAPRMDDASLFRHAGERTPSLPVVLDWSAGGGLLETVQRCNNNGACRKRDPGVMCPSFRATRDERHSTRGRANALRLALTGQLGENGLTSPDMADAMALCIGCKGCTGECPTGVDMSRLKLEWHQHQRGAHGLRLRERILAHLPRHAPRVARVAGLANALGRVGLVRRLAEKVLGLSARRALPRWAPDPWRDTEAEGTGAPDDVVLFVDTFSRWFEPEVPRAAAAVLAAGARGCLAPDNGPATGPATGHGRPLCCGRTYLSSGLVPEARAELARTVAALAPAARAGRWVVGLEPSCILTLRDEAPWLLDSDDARVVAERAVLLEELLDRDWTDGRGPPLGGSVERIAVHGHCHQKALGDAGATARVLRRIAGAQVSEIASGCCGMAGAFGYHAEHRDLSLAMGELDLLPAVRALDADTRLVAAGTSCRAQIRDGSGRQAVHPAVALRDALLPKG